tara:strand:+ start:3392 stop:3868 length:477 start_codon:yes stop_codon:yes gene_type:complete
MIISTNFNETPPKRGWLANEPTIGGGYSTQHYECHIEDYGEDNQIELIGFRQYDPSDAQKYKDYYYPLTDFSPDILEEKMSLREAITEASENQKTVYLKNKEAKIEYYNDYLYLFINNKCQVGCTVGGGVDYIEKTFLNYFKAFELEDYNEWARKDIY